MLPRVHSMTFLSEHDWLCWLTCMLLLPLLAETLYHYPSAASFSGQPAHLSIWPSSVAPDSWVGQVLYMAASLCLSKTVAAALTCQRYRGARTGTGKEGVLGGLGTGGGERGLFNRGNRCHTLAITMEWQVAMQAVPQHAYCYALKQDPASCHATQNQHTMTTI